MGAAAERRKNLHDLLDRLPDEIVEEIDSITRRLSDELKAATREARMQRVREMTDRMIATHRETLQKLAL